MSPATKAIRLPKTFVAVVIALGLGMAQFVWVKFSKPTSEPLYGTLNGTPAQPGVWYAVTISQPARGPATTNVNVLR